MSEPGAYEPSPPAYDNPVIADIVLHSKQGGGYDDLGDVVKPTTDDSATPDVGKTLV